MRRIPVLALALFCSMTLSCDDAPTGIGEDPGVLIAGSPEFSLNPVVAAEGNSAEVSWAPFGFQVVGCEGEEDVWVEGFSHTVRKDGVPGANNWHTFLTVNAEGVGIGLETGARYIWNDKITWYQYSDNGAASSLKQMMVSRLIGQGSAPDLRFHGLARYVVNANGEVTVDFDVGSQVCK